MSLFAFLSPPGIFRDDTSNKMYIFWEVSLELLNPEDGGSNVLRNVPNDLQIDKAKYPGRRIFSKPAVRSSVLLSPQSLTFASLSYIRLRAGQPRSRGRDRHASNVKNEWGYTSMPSGLQAYTGTTLFSPYYRITLSLVLCNLSNWKVALNKP